MSFTYTNEHFDGPLYVLLSLIESHTLSISTISLASITEEFLQYVSQMHQFDPTSVSEFLSIASTLVVIKTKALLPNIEISEEESTDIEELQKRLQYYQYIQSGSEHIQALWQANKQMYIRNNEWFDATTFLPGSTLNPVHIHFVLKQLVERILNKNREVVDETIPEISVAPVVRIEQIIEKINRLLKNRALFNFSDTVSGAVGSVEHKITTIVSFLALLELARSSSITLIQSAEFSEIQCSVA